MSNSEYLTGNEIIDELQGAQIVLGSLDSIEKKVARFRHAMSMIHSTSILEKSCMVSTTIAFGRPFDGNPQNRYLFKEGLMFTGLLNEFSYLFDEDIPIDSLSCDFTRLDVLQAETEQEKDFFRGLTLQVPILSIDTLICL
jgi:hypothetical protein